MHQYLKLEKRKISKISEYCPLDLFSKDKRRMKKSIYDLLQNPQNNLKIYEDGILTFTGSLVIYKFFQFTINVLKKGGASSINVPNLNKLNTMLLSSFQYLER